MSDLAERLREHANRIAGGGAADADYDPETLALEHEAADRVEALEAEVARLTTLLQEEQGESLRQAEIARDALAEVERRDLAYEDLKREYDHKCERVDTLQARVRELEAVQATAHDAVADLEWCALDPIDRGYPARSVAALKAALAAVDAEGNQP